MQNLNYLFNKAYYQNLGNPNFERDVKEINHKIEHTQFDESDYKPSPFDCQTIVMKIGYPGLIIGMGNPHGVGTKDFKWKDDIKFNKESGTFKIVGKLKERLYKFLNEENFEDVLRYAVNAVLGLGWKNNKSADEPTEDTIFDKITDEQIASVNNCLLNGRKPNIVFVNSKGQVSRFNSLEELKKLAEKIVDMCISGNEEIKTGFSFDYTTGQPYIPASSVKGMLRSYFKEHRQAVSEIIKAKTDKEFSEDEIALLESDIFDYNDIFLDTVVYWGDKYGHMLSSDYITPHDTDHIKNPVPIRILKINPGVRLEFRFLLNDHTVNDKTVKKDMLKDIFTELLSLFGVGAKTNVGYGIMQPNDDRPAYKPEPVPSESLPKKDIPKSKDYPEKVNCQKCGCPNFKFDKKGNLHKYCYKCNAKLN